jgi:hypothetical protein
VNTTTHLEMCLALAAVLEHPIATGWAEVLEFARAPWRGYVRAQP